VAVELRERSIQIALDAKAVIEPHEPLPQAVARL
jgi:hypothetical protein